jgi:imidazole glycerol-phosphate synthase subunit HisH
MIAIMDYEAGNLTSVARALNKLKLPNRITSDREEILNADRIIFPGVGAAGAAMANLHKKGLDEVIKTAFSKEKPILGICVGAQIILDFSEENETACLGLISGQVVGFPSGLADGNGSPLKIPHMGWNQVEWIRPHPIFQNIPERSEFYFVHSYYPVPGRSECVIGLTGYGIRFASAIGHKNLVAVQFHPEKSGPVGLSILWNFSSWNGKA